MLEGRMTAQEVRIYLSQMLEELADLADGHAEDEELGRLAFQLRLFAEKVGREGPRKVN